MKIAGIPMNDIWAHRVLRERGVETARAENIRAEIAVFVESIDLGYHSASLNYRPYLHLSGELRSVHPYQRLPHDVDEVVYPAGGGERADIFYEFDDEQLVRLTKKGYFSAAFTLPEQVTGIVWELPATIDALVLAPADSQAGGPDTSPLPVVFVRVHDLGSIDTDLQSSGYDLTEYFADHSTQPSQPIGDVINETQVRSDGIRPLFDQSDSERAQPGRTPLTAATEPLTGTLAQRLQAVAMALDDEEQQLLQQRAEQKGTTEHLYQSRVAVIVEDPAPGTGSDLIDLTGRETTESPAAPAQTAEPAQLEGLKQDIAHQAASLDLGAPESSTEHQP